MSIRERAAAALVRAREAGIAVPATDPPHRQRLRAALTRDIATLLAVPADHILVGDDPLRSYGGVPGPADHRGRPRRPRRRPAVHPRDRQHRHRRRRLPAARRLPRLQRRPARPGRGAGGGDHRARRSRQLPTLPCGCTSTRPRYPSSSSTTPPTHPTAPSASPPPNTTPSRRGMSGMRAEITTVGELVAALAAYPPQTRVQLAVAPGYPQAATIGAIACSPDDADGPRDGRPPDPDGNGWCGSAKAPSSATCPRSPATPSATAGPEHHSIRAQSTGDRGP